MNPETIVGEIVGKSPYEPSKCSWWNCSRISPYEHMCILIIRTIVYNNSTIGICMYIYIYIYIYTSIYISIVMNPDERPVCPRSPPRRLIFMYVCISLSIFIYLSIYLSISIYTYIHIYIHIYIYIYQSISLSIYIYIYREREREILL